uniref:SFRICE_021270 n=1 Tax=Spodoptera frugiperda TaxID=7108 RepID=A0A2H1V7C6_SPOFR
MEVNGTEARAEEAAVTLALSVAVTVISAIGLLLNAYILFIIVITKQLLLWRTSWARFDECGNTGEWVLFVKVAEFYDAGDK